MINFVVLSEILGKSKSKNNFLLILHCFCNLLHTLIVYMYKNLTILVYNEQTT